MKRTLRVVGRGAGGEPIAFTLASVSPPGKPVCAVRQSLMDQSKLSVTQAIHLPDEQRFEWWSHVCEPVKA